MLCSEVFIDVKVKLLCSEVCAIAQVKFAYKGNFIGRGLSPTVFFMRYIPVFGGSKPPPYGFVF